MQQLCSNMIYFHVLASQDKLLKKYSKVVLNRWTSIFFQNTKGREPMISADRGILYRQDSPQEQEQMANLVLVVFIGSDASSDSLTLYSHNIVITGTRCYNNR
jgi:hypothetical protein